MVFAKEISCGAMQQTGMRRAGFGGEADMNKFGLLEKQTLNQ